MTKKKVTREDWENEALGILEETKLEYRGISLEVMEVAYNQ